MVLSLYAHAARCSKSLQLKGHNGKGKVVCRTGLRLVDHPFLVGARQCVQVQAHQQHNNGSSGSSSSSAAAGAQQDVANLLLHQQQLEAQMLGPAGPENGQKIAMPEDEIEQPLAAAEEQLEHTLTCEQSTAEPLPLLLSHATPHALQEPLPGETVQQWGHSMEFVSGAQPGFDASVADMQPQGLCTLLLGCARADVTPSLKWTRTTLTALIESLETSTPVPVAAAQGAAAQQQQPQQHRVHEQALMQLPHVMDLVLSYGSGQALRQLCVRGVLLVDNAVDQMTQQDLLHLLKVSLHLQQEDSTAQQQGEEWQYRKHLLLRAVLQRMQQLPWGPQDVGCLVSTLTCLSQLAVPLPTSWLASCLRHMGQATIETVLTAQHVLDLASILRSQSTASSDHIATQGGGAGSSAVLGGADGSGQGLAAAADCWLLWWLEATAQAVLVRDMPSMTMPQLLGAAKLLADIHTSAETCPAAFEDASVFAAGDFFCQEEEEDGMCVLAAETIPGWAPEQLVLREVVQRLETMPPQELVQHTALLLTALLPQEHLTKLLDACLPRLYFMLGDVQPSDASSLLLALAQCKQLPDLQRVQPLARALAESTCPLLPSCPLPDLVQLLSALALLDVRPSIAWQDSYFQTLRTRLALFEADELSDMLACMDALGLQPSDEKWTDRIFLLSRKLLEDMDAAQVADIVWWFSQHAVCMEWTWVPGYELVSRPQLKDLSPALLAVTIKGLNKLGFTPGTTWLSEFLDVVEARLFAPSAMHPCIISVEEGSQLNLDQLMTRRMAARIRRRCLNSSTAAGRARVAESQLILDDEGGGSATVDILTSLVDAMNYCRVSPPKSWMASFCDAVRCKMTLLKPDERLALLTFMTAVAYRPEQHWWDDFLGIMRYEELSSMNLNTQVTTLSLLHSLDVRPSTEWLDAWCAACQEKLCLLLPQQLIQVISCLAVCGYTPPLGWLVSLGTALEHAARTMMFEPHELVRCIVILDKMGLCLTPGLLAILYSETGQTGLRLLDPPVLVQALWMVQSVSIPPNEEWLSAYIAAAQRYLPVFTTTQVEALVSGVIAVCAAQQHSAAGGGVAGAPTNQQAQQVPPYVTTFQMLAREFMV